MNKTKNMQPQKAAQSKIGCKDQDRRRNDRRVCQKKGFAYISIVGWMCRRENTRRKGDNVCGW